MPRILEIAGLIVWFMVRLPVLLQGGANSPSLRFQRLAFFTFQIVEREARMKERLRIAQDLHDSLGHHLTALTLNLESALRREGAEARADVEKAQSLARGLLADVREIVADN